MEEIFKGAHKYGRFGPEGQRIETLCADYIVTDGTCVRFYVNHDAKAVEDHIVAVMNLAPGQAVIRLRSRVKKDDVDTTGDCD